MLPSFSASIKFQRPLSNFSNQWRGVQKYDHAFSFDKRNDFYDEIVTELVYLNRIGYPIFYHKKQFSYYNIPTSFDIETSSFRLPSNNKKAACMYIWQFGFNGSVIYGRTWDEFFLFLEEIRQVLKLSNTLRMICYVHNLSYEFQWIKKYFEWDKVFALKKRKVLVAGHYGLGIEFRCSYLLANASLVHVGEKMLTKYKISKLVGQLDYKKIRSSNTPILSNELDYCLNDVRVVMSFIQEKIENDGGIGRIPLTNTGYVRNHIRSCCMDDKYDGIKFRQVINALSIDNADEYDQNKRVLMGGFTHTGILHANRILEDVGSADLISSYPASMCGDYFPMSKAKFIGCPKSKKEFIGYLNSYCCIFDIEFTNLMPAVEFENYLSVSKCIAEDYTLNNGRIVSAKKCLTTLTELDFDLVQRLYIWTSMKITNLRIYTRGYLPKCIIQAVLDLYAKKTKLKDVPEEVIEYMRSKNMVNASYGMMVTDIIRPFYALNEEDEWIVEKADVEQQLFSYNHNFTRFLYYTWGIYVTAHARHNLFEAILEFGEDYVYADTDSIKGVNFEKHLQFFKVYNLKNRIKMQKMCNYMGIDFSLVCPKTVKGESKLLGDWEIERPYRYFKAAGAKRYMYIYYPDKKHPEGEFSLTVSGLNKTKAIPYLLKTYSGDRMKIFKAFEDGFYVASGNTGKQTLTYIDEAITGYAFDYLGNRFEFHEESCINMEEQGFVMSQTDEYLDLLAGLQHDELY